MTTKRDPRVDPRPGDTIARISGVSNSKHTRIVLDRVNNDITYRDERGREHTCWLTTWMDWARMAEVENQKP